MTAARPICRACGHEKAHHVGGKGPCSYGHGGLFGGCTCAGFNKRRARTTPTGTPTLITLAEAFAQLRADVDAAFSRFAVFVGEPADLVSAHDIDPEKVLSGITSRKAPKKPEEKRGPPPGRVARAGKLGSGERKVLTAIAQHLDGVTPEQLTVLTGYKRSSRNTYLQRLKAAGLIGNELNGRIGVSSHGLNELGPSFTRLPTGAALRRHWLERLPVGERTILELLVDAHPEGLAPDLLDGATGYKRSSRNTYLQRLSSRELIVRERGQVFASSELFS